MYLHGKWRLGCNEVTGERADKEGIEQQETEVEVVGQSPLTPNQCQNKWMRDQLISFPIHLEQQTCWSNNIYHLIQQD